MRIISGNLKGRKLIEPKNKNTRPLKDLTKESIFNIIEHSNLVRTKINNSKVLDLFAGTGSFGLECISRGSSNVTFVENYPDASDVLKKNIEKFNCEDKSIIINEDIINDDIETKLVDKKFDIIFLDPPYKTCNFINVLNKIINIKILNKNGIMIIHRSKKTLENLPKKFQIIQIKTYGISKIIFGY
ncbi:MAG: 16S rRNA (guanine(966)-N(2))-methyltransferase RsmD [Candidatus Pelagibacter sp.]|tara:strand:- start:459 stop:1019 length:561 start_codon:yes stop_codon:yes gene_type:complete